MKERPIIMLGGNVQAICDNRKRQTRRVIKGFPLDSCWTIGKRPKQCEPLYHVFFDEADPVGTYPTYVKCPYGVPGDRLWVREKVRLLQHKHNDDLVVGACFRHIGGGRIFNKNYKSHYPLSERARFTPSIHMPKWAARIWLEITGIRVERLQEISPRECLAEGIINQWTIGADSILREKFKSLWDSINSLKGYGWSTNPIVWVIEFKRIDCPPHGRNENEVNDPSAPREPRDSGQVKHET